MNIYRLIWVSTTVLFCFIGFLLGLSLGRMYVASYAFAASIGDAVQLSIIGTLAVGGAIIFARFGSWLADRFLLNTLSHMQQVSAADRVLGVVGALLGLLFGVLVTLPLLGVSNKLLAIPIQLCIMMVSAVFGMALMQGMREEMLHVFPALEEDAVPGTPRCSAKILDTNIIIDGRMADICKTGFIEGPLYIPSFVLEEVQYIADSADSLKRARGRRGLDVLNLMREMMVPNPAHPEQQLPVVQVVSEFSAEVRKIKTVDSKLVALAKETQAAIVTNDFNLNRVAELQGVRVLNINELVHALRPVVLPGEEMTLMISREGKEAGQGVGYLDDGTMVVVGDGRRHIGETCTIVISSVIQTVAGKMIFAEMKAEGKERRETSRETSREPSSGIKGSGDDLFNEGDTRKGDGHGQGQSAGNGDDSGRRSGGGMRRKSRS